MKKDTAIILNNLSINTAYMVGIGGVGMSALALYFLNKGVKVEGYDLRPSAITDYLQKHGANIHFTDDISLVPKDADVVIYTPAIPANHQELNFYKANNYMVVKRSEVLGWITQTSFNVCVAGSHGKTTVSTMIGYLLRETGYGCNAFLGGISGNYNTNFWSSDKNISVLEADEYDRSFLRLSPNIAVITAMDADHLEIYETLENVEDAYLQFASQLKEGGLLITKYGLKKQAAFSAINHLTYHLEDDRANIFAKNIHIQNGAYHFDLQYRNEEIKGFVLNVGGLHNVENAIAAITVAKTLGIENEKLIATLKNFKGVKRRFEQVLMRSQSQPTVLIDDYAHHPEELNALIRGVRSLYVDEKMTVIFQPHLFSRTKDFAKDFAQSLDGADEVILLPIYPARELPMKGVSSELIANEMQLLDKKILDKASAIAHIREKKPSLIVMCGAGDIGEMVSEIKDSIIGK